MALTVNGNRLDAEWVCNDGVIRDRFTMMKDVNKKELYFTAEGDSVNLLSTWLGNYNWTGGYNTKNITVAPLGIDTDTFIVTDNFNCLRDSFIITKSIQLPVELISFNAHKTTNYQVILNWTTATEFQNQYFSVEWSKDAVNFSSIGTVSGNGTTNMQHSYSFLHQQPVTGNNYYRLKQVDKDSTFSYSEIVKVFLDNFLTVTIKDDFMYVYPNPSKTGEFDVDYYSTKNKTTTLKVFDLLGKLIYSDVWLIYTGISNYKLNLKEIPNGSYILMVDQKVIKLQK